MRFSVDRFNTALDLPIPRRFRLALGMSAAFLVAAGLLPLWRISMRAPQYPRGLAVDIYCYKIAGGHGGEDLQEINDLNHYVGMAPIDRASLSDLDWLPFALGVLLLFLLRVAAIGNLRSLVDLWVLGVYLGTFSFARFVYRLYVLGHNLSPTAPIKLGPFMPAVLGTRQLGNFTVSSYPMAGTACLGLLMAVLAALAARMIAGSDRGSPDRKPG